MSEIKKTRDNEKTPINLKEVYAQKALFYWCNSTGDICVPGMAPWPCQATVDDLPPKIREIYESFWTEDEYGTWAYAVTLNGQPGLMLGWLFDYGWLKDIKILTDENLDIVKPLFHDAVFKAAEQLQTKIDSSNTAVLYGFDTDSDGDEILLFISYDELKNKGPQWVKEKAEMFSEEIYDDVQVCLENALEQRRPTIKIVIDEGGLYQEMFVSPEIAALGPIRVELIDHCTDDPDELAATEAAYADCLKEHKEGRLVHIDEFEQRRACDLEAEGEYE